MIKSQTFTEYMCYCDNCGNFECCPSSLAENVHSKQQARKWAGLHKTKDGKDLCNKCFKEYKKEVRGKNE